MTVSLFSVVVGDNDLTRLEAYLYDHTKLVASATVGRRTAYLLRTTVDYDGVDGADAVVERDRCGYLVRYQVGRLQSALYGEVGSGYNVVDGFDRLTEWLRGEASARV